MLQIPFPLGKMFQLWVEQYCYFISESTYFLSLRLCSSYTYTCEKSVLTPSLVIPYPKTLPHLWLETAISQIFELLYALLIIHKLPLTLGKCSPSHILIMPQLQGVPHLPRFNSLSTCELGLNIVTNKLKHAAGTTSHEVQLPVLAISFIPSKYLAHKNGSITESAQTSLPQ